MNQRPLKKLFVIVGLLLFSISCQNPIIESVIYLIPANYMGYVYIFHNVPDGEPLKREWFSRVYEIPKDGIVRSKGQGIANAVIPKYFYVMPDGKRVKIKKSLRGRGIDPDLDQREPRSLWNPTFGIRRPRSKLSGYSLNKRISIF